MTEIEFIKRLLKNPNADSILPFDHIAVLGREHPKLDTAAKRLTFGCGLAEMDGLGELISAVILSPLHFTQNIEGGDSLALRFAKRGIMPVISVDQKFIRAANGDAKIGEVVPDASLSNLREMLALAANKMNAVPDVPWAVKFRNEIHLPDDLEAPRQDILLQSAILSAQLAAECECCEAYEGEHDIPLIFEPDLHRGHSKNGEGSLRAMFEILSVYEELAFSFISSFRRHILKTSIPSTGLRADGGLDPVEAGLLGRKLFADNARKDWGLSLALSSSFEGPQFRQMMKALVGFGSDDGGGFEPAFESRACAGTINLVGCFDFLTDNGAWTPKATSILKWSLSQLSSTGLQAYTPDKEAELDELKKA